ncbi:hypothetical protein A2J03_09810 [Rhodococcus sp. EPR-157]|uniref:hypothetical protein n=1 Tax=Rhodococcus sp. EPR-157 TaxID=1813677 RepID=UPI0007BC1184|nr:hypothetical protein [Rhodococcus sp. EPR-157]KZF00871.1 hypothetical protein A2J03_09810 [Rhodococcus sp. EPR-157]
MIRVILPNGEEKKFVGNYTVEKNPDTGSTIRILEGVTPVFDVPPGSEVVVAQADDNPVPRIDPK